MMDLDKNKTEIKKLIKNNYLFILKIIIIYIIFYTIGLLIVGSYIKLSGNSLFWTCATIIQGLGTLLALIGMFLIFQFQIINTLIIETHRKSEFYGDQLSNYKLGEKEYKYWDELVKTSQENLNDYDKQKSRLKKMFFRPLFLMGLSLTLSFIGLPLGDFSFIKPNITYENFPFISISSYLLPLLIFSVWSIFSLILAIVKTVGYKIKWSYYRPRV